MEEDGNSSLRSRNYCKRASQEQKEGLIVYLESNLEVARRNYESMYGTRTMHEKWDEIAELLNEYDGAFKTGTQWKRYWMDTQKHIRKKCQKVNCKQENNMRLESHEIITTLDERIISLMNNDSQETKAKNSEKKNKRSIEEDDTQDYNELSNNTISSEDNESLSMEIPPKKQSKRKADQKLDLSILDDDEIGSQADQPKNKKQKHNDSSDDNLELQEMRIAIEKDRVKALRDISSSIRYLADAIKLAFSNNDGLFNKT